MNKLSKERRAQVVKALVEGTSINATVRMTGISKVTILKLLRDLGTACDEYQDAIMHDLPIRRIECDEIWSFCYAKAKNVPAEHKGEPGYGDVWVWAGIDCDTKLIPCWHVGSRDGRDAWDFIANLRSRLASPHIQLSTDGHKAYLEAIEGAFGGDVDYAQVIKVYGGESKEEQRRYSPADCISVEKKVITGKPDEALISTSYIERQNLTMRMSMRRFTRLTNGFSKKLENHMHAIALHFMHYNFARPHKSLANPYPRTPAMAIGLTDHVWSVDEIISLLDK